MTCKDILSLRFLFSLNFNFAFLNFIQVIFQMPDLSKDEPEVSDEGVEIVGKLLQHFETLDRNLNE